MIPTDNILMSAINEVTKSQPSMSLVKVMAGVQNTQPDWTINKRRVKRLLRAMKRHAWQANMRITPPADAAESRTNTTTLSNRRETTCAEEEDLRVEVAMGAEADIDQDAPMVEGMGDGVDDHGDLAAPDSVSEGSSHCTESGSTRPASPAATEPSSPVVPTLETVNLSTQVSMPQDVASDARDGILMRVECFGSRGGEGEGQGEEESRQKVESAAGLDQSLHLEPGLELEPDTNLSVELGLASSMPCIPSMEGGVATERYPHNVQLGGKGKGLDAREGDLGFELIDMEEVEGLPEGMTGSSSLSGTGTSRDFADASGPIARSSMEQCVVS